MTESYEEEMESVKVSTARQQQTILDKLEMEHNAKMGRLNKKVLSKNYNYLMLKFAVSTYSEIFKVHVVHLPFSLEGGDIMRSSVRLWG